MTGRNEPCPCGSGKKYKKCCGSGEAAGQPNRIKEELLKINEEFQLKGLQPETIIRIEERKVHWLEELRGVFPDTFTEQAAFDTYALLDHPEDWRNFLDRQLKRHPRAEVAEILRAWRHPLLLLAKAERAENGRLFVKDEMSGRIYEAVNEPPELANQWFLGVALLYPAAGDLAVMFMHGTMYLKEDTPPHFIEGLKEKMPTGDFLLLLKLLIGPNEEENEPELSPFGREVLEKVDRFLGPSAEESGALTLTKELLKNVKINAKKPEAVAAGIVQAAVDIGIVHPLLTQKQLAGAFGVSVMTMLKYRDMAADFIISVMEESGELESVKNEGGWKLDEPAGGAGEILQVKVKLLRTSPPVWRRLLVDSRMSFSKFHEVLQTAFEWDNDHLHDFRMTRTGGEANQNVVISMDDEELDLPFFLPSIIEKLDENEERLEDWFLEVKDRAVYTYDFGADWEHEIVLEKRLPAKPGMRYPYCVKAKGEAPGEYGFEPEDEEWEASPDDITEVVNDLLELVHADLITENREPSGASGNSWQRLLMEMAALRKLEPWKWLYDDQVFAVQDPAGETTVFVSVLGAAGEEFGLAVYIGEEGYESMLATMSGKVSTEELVFAQRSLLASFSDRDELEAEDLQLLKDAGMSFRGKKQWPLFRSMMPGYYPWSIDEEEARLLIEVIGQTKAVVEKVKSGMQIQLSEDKRSFFGRRMNEAGEWQNDRFIIDKPANPKKKPAAELMISDIEIARLKKKKTTASLKVEYGQFHINQPAQDEPGERPYFPVITVALDAASGMVLHQHLDGRKEKAEIAQQGLLNFIKEYGKIPGTLAVTEETERLIRPLTDRLSLSLKIKQRLPELERLKQAMARM